MNPRVKDVKPLNGYKLLLTFHNGEKRIYNMNGTLEKGIFKELKDIRIFNTVKAVNGTVQWLHEQDICPDTLYLDSIPAENNEMDVNC
jgi:hypothetical protein